jgi:hypothetical protein
MSLPSSACGPDTARSDGPSSRMYVRKYAITIIINNNDNI